MNKKIEFNKVTWYSITIAIVLYIFVFELGFYLGQKDEAIRNMEIEEVKPSTITAVFGCADAKAIYTEFTKNNVRIKLSDGRELSLPQAISASGARYANNDESFIFWNKGNGAFIEEKGVMTFKDCITEE